jgi:hypothetical protein
MFAVCLIYAEIIVEAIGLGLRLGDVCALDALQAVCGERSCATAHYGASCG